MIFSPPSWLPGVAEQAMDAGPVGRFVLEGTGRPHLDGLSDEPIFISAATKKSTSSRQIANDVETLAAALAHELGWRPNETASGGKIVAILSENTIDYVTYCWAFHRVGATCLLLHAASSPAENANHLGTSGCKVVVVSPALHQSARASVAGQSDVQIYLTEAISQGSRSSNGHAGTNGASTGNGPNDQKDETRSLKDMLALGKTLDQLPALEWSAEVARSSVAFLCPTSGTSGVQKLAELTHRGFIANLLQLVAFDDVFRTRETEVVLGILPMSHAHGMMVAHGSVLVRDRLVLHSKFDMKAALASVQAFKINRLYVTPAILANIVSNPFLFKVFDLASVETLFVGAGGVSSGLHAKVTAIQPSWRIVTGYGLTESSAAVTLGSPKETFPGSSGTLLPLFKARLLRDDGSEVESFDEAGELVVSSPSLVAGYTGDTDGTARLIRDGWLHTGDIAMFRKSPSKDSHIFIVDRLRDMIKVKGLQVSPIAIEACLREKPGVGDVAVIGVLDDIAGERPRAFIVPAQPLKDAGAKTALCDELDDHVQSKLTEEHWLRGRYEMLEELPRTATGKVAKGVLRKRVLYLDAA